MADTRNHIRRLPEIEARDEQYMVMRRAGHSSVDAARCMGLTEAARRRVEAGYNAEYGVFRETPANDDQAYVAAIKRHGGFGRFLETRGADGQPRLTGPYVPFALERRVNAGRARTV